MGNIKKICLDEPNIGELEKTYLARCIDSTFVSTYGPFVAEFEETFSRFLKIDRCVALQSGTAGLHAALHELGIGPGDEVIVPVLTFVATANVVRYVSATPVFVDVAPDTWTIAPDLIEKAITPRTRAIIPVHLYGNPCDMRRIMDIAAKHELCVIEDATESLGSRFDGQLTGTFGDFGVFSFNGNKLITTGGGGMITGRDPERLGHIKYLINQARDASDSYTHSEIGFNYRMTNLEASLGLAQMARIEEFMARKRRFASIYADKFRKRRNIMLQQAYPDSDVLWWLTSCMLTQVDEEASLRNIQSALLQTYNVPTRRIFKPLVAFAPYAANNPEDYPNAFRIFNSGLTLPGSTVNDDDVVEYVADALIRMTATHTEHES